MSDATPSVAATPGTQRFRRPHLASVLAVMGALVVIIAVFTPEPTAIGGEFTSYSTGPYGARVIYDLADRLGWRVQRRTSSEPPPVSAHTVNVVLDPAEALDGHEVHTLLETVRAGGGLIVSGDIDAMQDSLGYRITEGGLVSERDEEHCAELRDPFGVALAAGAKIATVSWRRPAPSPPTAFAMVKVTDAGGGERPAFVGVQLGLGRVAIAGSGGVLANDVVRRCRLATDVAFVRALEFLRGGGGAPNIMVFDEFHHGYGAHPGSMRAISEYATQTQSGHALLQAALAGVLLLLAAAPRVIAPQAVDRVPRRSPLEHADALAHAYMSVKATRTIATRLVAGVRRRTGMSRAGRSLTEDAFLTWVAGAWPTVSADVEIVRRALQQQVTPAELAGVAESLERIEATLSHPRTSGT